MINRASINANPWKAAASDPESWHATTFDRAEELLNVMPPIYFPGGFAVGEAIRHDSEGRAVYLAVAMTPGCTWVRELAIKDAPAAVVALRQVA